MGDDDWYFLTYMKLCFRREDYRLARHHLNEHNPRTQHSKDWAQLFEVALGIIERRSVEPSDLEAIDSIRSSYQSYDEPGEPWISLFVGPLVAQFDSLLAIELVESAAGNAERMGKYFLVAALYEELAAILASVGNRSWEARLAYTRSINAYGKCHLLLQNPLRSRLARLGSIVGIDGETIGTLALQSSSLLLDRSTLNFSEMCSRIAQDRGMRADEIFEDFVREWAQTKFPGKPVDLPAGESAIDVLLVRTVNGEQIGIAIQAKHYTKPKDSVPTKNPLLREVALRYQIARFERYVFVVSTADPQGWRNEMWHAQTSQAVRNIVSDTSIPVTVVIEPELQTDVVLSDLLLRKYFHR